MDLRAQDLSSAAGRGHSRDLYGIRPAAQTGATARRDPRRQGTDLVLGVRRPENRPGRSCHRCGQGIRHCDFQARVSDRRTGLAQRPRRQAVDRQHVPGLDRAFRSGHRKLQVFLSAGPGQPVVHTVESGGGQQCACRRQGMGAEQRLRRRASLRPRHRQGGNLGAVFRGQGAAQYLRRHFRFAKQRVFHRLPATPHRPHRRQNRRGEAL